MGPLAQKVKEALWIGGESGAMAASFGEPEELGYESDSSRDERIKEWGLYVGLAFAISFAENPFAGAEPAITEAHEAAREVMFDENKDLRPTEAVSA